MNKITEDMELWKFDGVTGVGIYAGGLTWLSHAPVKWRKETHGFYGEIEVLKLSEIVEQVKMNCIPIITVIIESPMDGQILQYGNYNDGCWYEIGQTCGYA